MRILILHRKDATNPEAGGGTLYIHRIAKCLVRKGHEVTLVCANYPGGKKKEDVDGVAVLRLSGKNLSHFLAPVHYLMKFRGKFDILIDVINGPPWFSPLYSSVPKIAIVFQTFREVFFSELNKPLACLMYLAEKIFPYVYRNVPVVTLSPSVKDELIGRGILKENVFIVPPGIDFGKYRPGRKSGSPFVLYVGRLKKYKGIEYLISSMKEVTRAVRDARLLIVGKGEHASQLISYTERLGLDDIVEFLGYVSEERKAKLMKGAHVLVIPSIKEGWGIPVIEAGACGTPSIGTDTTGLRDTIIDGKTGFLVPYGEPRFLAKKIVRIAEDVALRDRLSANAVQWAKRFDWKKSEEKFISILEDFAHVRLLFGD